MKTNSKSIYQYNVFLFFLHEHKQSKHINILFLIKKAQYSSLHSGCEICPFRCVSVSAEEEPLATARVKDSADGQNSQNKGQARLICFVPLASNRGQIHTLFWKTRAANDSEWERDKTERENTTAKLFCFPSLASAQWALGVNGRASFTLMRRVPPEFRPAPHALEPQSLTHNKTIIVIVTPGSTSNVTFSPRGVLNRPNDSRNVHLACCKPRRPYGPRHWGAVDFSKPAPQSRQPVTADHRNDISHPHQSKTAEQRAASQSMCGLFGSQRTHLGY